MCASFLAAVLAPVAVDVAADWKGRLRAVLKFQHWIGIVKSRVRVLCLHFLAEIRSCRRRDYYFFLCCFIPL